MKVERAGDPTRKRVAGGGGDVFGATHYRAAHRDKLQLFGLIRRVWRPTRGHLAIRHSILHRQHNGENRPAVIAGPSDDLQRDRLEFRIRTGELEHGGIAAMVQNRVL